MASFSLVAGVGIAAVAPELALPGFVAVEVYRRTAVHKPALMLGSGDGAGATILSGFEYAIGYWIGAYVMNQLFGSQ